jgi:hypothetical protein
MSFHEVCALLQQQTATVIQLEAEKDDLVSQVAELTPFRSRFFTLQEKFEPLKSSESDFRSRATLLKVELEAAMQIVQSHANENSRLKEDLATTLKSNVALKCDNERMNKLNEEMGSLHKGMLEHNKLLLAKNEQLAVNFNILQRAVFKNVSSNVLKGVVSNAASMVAKKTATAVATQTEAEVSAASDLDKIASDLEKTRAVASSQTKILDLSTEILTLTIRNNALTTKVESLQLDLDGARQALATQTKAPATQPERTMGKRLVPGKVALLAIAAFTGALAVAKNPEAAKDAAVKGCAFVAEKASSVASFLAEKGRFGLDFLRNSNNVNAVEIDLTKMLKQ